MEKLEHLSIMLNRRTKGKKYENFIINSIYAKISNPELIPITQQYVKNTNAATMSKRKYYLLDLYFPQINYGIEVDESHHLCEENRIQDYLRAEDILGSIQCEQGRIAIYNDDGTLKTYDEVNDQINKQIIHIKKMITQKYTVDKICWEDNESRKRNILQKGVFSTKDDVDFEGVTEIYNLLGHDIKNLGRCFVKLNNKYKLWVPHLAVQLEDGTIKTKNGWENTLNEDKSLISEVVGNMKKCDTRELPEGPWNENGYKRVVFMHIRDSFGMERVKFLGVFEAFELKVNKGIQTRFYKRVKTEITISELI
ncbi:AbaSI family restriction endonuclease [Spirochaeta dissipatitropha]